MSSALVLESVNALIACKDLDELASSAALLAQRLLGVSRAVVVLRSSEREFASPASSGSAELGSWATGLLAALPHRRLSSSGRLRAIGIEPSNLDVHGVLATAVEARGGADPAQQDTAKLSDDDDTANQDTKEQESLLVALADLIATCSAQIVRRSQADSTLQETRALVTRGLHDLCTPLNSLRLGMHLLEPALTTKDPAVAQRAHRAVDRMADLVTGMAEAIRNGSSSAQHGVSARPASTTQH